MDVNGSPNGVAEEVTNAAIDEWLLGDSAEPEDPIPLHRFQICCMDYTRENSSRWRARRQFQVGRDITDEALMNQAREDAKRIRALMESSLEGMVAAWPEMTDAQREDLRPQLPEEVKAALASNEDEVESVTG